MFRSYIDLNNTRGIIDLQIYGLFSELIGGSIAGEADVATLQSDDPNACNTFEAPRTVVPAYEKGRWARRPQLRCPRLPLWQSP